MSGHFTRRMYDPCFTDQETKQSTKHLEFIIDVNKFVNNKNACDQTNGNYDSSRLVELDSSLRGLDRVYNKCNSSMYPMCSPNGCMMANDSKIPPYNSPYLAERGYGNENEVVSNNIPRPTSNGIPNINTNLCRNIVDTNGNYISNTNTNLCGNGVDTNRNYIPNINTNLCRNSVDTNGNYMSRPNNNAR